MRSSVKTFKVELELLNKNEISDINPWQLSLKASYEVFFNYDKEVRRDILHAILLDIVL